MYVATLVTVAGALLLCVAGYTKIWPLFGACNQLVAVPAFLAIATYLKKIGKNNKMLYIPIVFMSIATLTSLVMSFINNTKSIMGGATGATLFTNILQDVIIVPIFVLAIILILEGGKVLLGKKEA